jgi:malonyl-CoA O-methyltransferase
MLDAGSGTGYVSTQLRARYKDARSIELDLALSMLKVSAAKLGMLSRLFGKPNWPICADLEAIPLADNSVELLCSNLAIQWLNEPDRAFAEFHRVLKPEGLLMFSTFGPDTLKELRQAFARADERPHVNRFIDMHDLGDALSHAGFASPVMDMDKIVLTYADIKAVMRDLKAIGAHNTAVGRGRGMMGRQAFARAEAAYEQLRKDGRLPATYEIVYGHAWKPTPKPVFADGRQVIEFRPRAK